ncbi:hypothetical protein [Streptomyces sp. UG1]|uniref:hypothetical protein n=1 Tax=Streptomyces sp. UG1 TaxID=3417652 RepID=UPI003CF1118D
MHRQLAHGVRASLRNNGQAYGFSVSITASAAMLHAEARQSGTAHLIYFAVGAAVAFSLLQTLATSGFRKPLEQEPSTVTALGIALSIVSVTTVVTLAWAVAHFVGGMAAWPLTGFLVSVVYPVAAGLELAVAQRFREASDEDTKKETSKEEEAHDQRNGS